MSDPDIPVPPSDSSASGPVRPPLLYRIRVGALSGCLYGAAAGMLLGLFTLDIDPQAEAEAVTVWRNIILAGGGMGLLLGAVLGIRLVREWR